MLKMQVIVIPKSADRTSDGENVKVGSLEVEKGGRMLPGEVNVQGRELDVMSTVGHGTLDQDILVFGNGDRFEAGFPRNLYRDGIDRLLQHGERVRIQQGHSRYVGQRGVETRV